MCCKKFPAAKMSEPAHEGDGAALNKASVLEHQPYLTQHSPSRLIDSFIAQYMQQHEYKCIYPVRIER